MDAGGDFLWSVDSIANAGLWSLVSIRSAVVRLATAAWRCLSLERLEDDGIEREFDARAGGPLFGQPSGYDRVSIIGQDIGQEWPTRRPSEARSTTAHLDPPTSAKASAK